MYRAYCIFSGVRSKTFWSAFKKYLECTPKKHSTAWNKQYSALIVEGMPVVTHADVIYELCG